MKSFKLELTVGFAVVMILLVVFVIGHKTKEQEVFEQLVIKVNAKMDELIDKVNQHSIVLNFIIEEKRQEKGMEVLGS